jgi:hypothetical protein
MRLRPRGQIPQAQEIRLRLSTLSSAWFRLNVGPAAALADFFGVLFDGVLGALRFLSCDISARRVKNQTKKKKNGKKSQTFFRFSTVIMRFSLRTVVIALVLLVLSLATWHWRVHGSVAAVDLDVIFQRGERPNAVGLLRSDLLSVLGAACAEPRVPERAAVFRRALEASAFGELERGMLLSNVESVSLMPLVPAMMHMRPLLSNLCEDAAVREQASVLDASALLVVPAEKLVALLVALRESGYGENSEQSLRSTLGALSGGEFKHRVFADLGSGRGKVLAAACTQRLDVDGAESRFAFDECVGVEGSPERVAVARELHLAVQRELRAAGDAALAARLNATVRIQHGDLRSGLLAGELFPRATHIYAYNTLFGAELDASIANGIAKHARPGVRVGLHTFHASAWPKERFALVKAHAANEVVWTAFYVLEVR